MTQEKNRKSNRLKDYDYSRNGYYFVTICIKDRQELFGTVENNQMILNDLGKIAEKCWIDLPNHYMNCALDEFTIMPNHIHGIVVIDNELLTNYVVTGFKPVTTKNHSLSEIIRGFKTFSSRCINELNLPLLFRWQRSFYDHIIRNEKSLEKIREYVVYNPLKWELDRNNTENLFM